MPDKWAQYIVPGGSKAQVNIGAAVGNQKPVGFSSGTSNPPGGGAVTNVDTPTSSDPWAQYIVPTQQPTPTGAAGPLPSQPSAPVPAGLQGPLTTAQSFNLPGRTLNAANDAGQFGIGALKTLGGNVASIDNAAAHIPYIGRALTTPLIGPGTSQQARTQLGNAMVPANGWQTAGKDVGNVAEFLAPGAFERDAVKAATLIPKIGRFGAPLARLGVSTLGSGAVNTLQGGSFMGGALAGGIGGAAGEASRAIAPAIAESALNVTGANRMYGRTVGGAILDDTNGIRPSTIERSARNTISDLTPQVEKIANDAGQAGSRGSLNPAITSVDQKIGKHIANRAVNSAAELKPLKTFLQRDAVTGLPLASSQPPIGLRQLKSGLDADFIGNWNPTRNTNNELDAAKSAYGKLADEFHAAAPGTAELDQRISSLIPVAERANRTALGAGVLQNTLNRFRTPTGALVGLLGGADAGYRERGVKGAIAGGLIGAVAPSILGAPATQMVFARGANRIVPKLVVPGLVGTGLQTKRSLYQNPK